MTQDPCLHVFDKAVWLVATRSEPPSAFQEPLAVNIEIKRQGRERNNGQQNTRHADACRPLLVDPHENRRRRVAQEDEAVDTAGDWHDVGDIEPTQDQGGNEPGPREDLRDREGAESRRGVTA